ncbi:hypothetical protein LINGRAHAP2_LOCUS25025, partial [Linum grandiflorum]
RNCQNITPPTQTAPPAPSAEPTTAGQPRVREEAEEQGRRQPRTVMCGHCKQAGHNARTCLIRKGVQGVAVDGTTPARVRQEEVSTTLNGVGLYSNPNTGNTYFTLGGRARRGSRGRGRRGPRGRGRITDEHAAGPSQPPATQPSG